MQLVLNVATMVDRNPDTSKVAMTPENYSHLLQLVDENGPCDFHPLFKDMDLTELWRLSVAEAVGERYPGMQDHTAFDLLDRQGQREVLQDVVEDSFPRFRTRFVALFSSLLLLCEPTHSFACMFAESTRTYGKLAMLARLTRSATCVATQGISAA